MTPTPDLPPGTPLTDGNGRVTPEWYRFFSSLAAVSNELATAINDVPLGPTTPSTVRCTALRIDTAPVAGLVVATHTVSISVNGVPYRVLIAS